MRADDSDAIWACGIGILGAFGDKYSSDLEVSCESIESRGTGYVQVAFIHSDACEEVEAFLDKRWKIVFESEKRINTNSDNEFWFKIYDYTQKPEA